MRYARVKLGRESRCELGVRSRSIENVGEYVSKLLSSDGKEKEGRGGVSYSQTGRWCLSGREEVGQAAVCRRCWLNRRGIMDSTGHGNRGSYTE